MCAKHGRPEVHHQTNTVAGRKDIGTRFFFHGAHQICQAFDGAIIFKAQFVNDILTGQQAKVIDRFRILADSCIKLAIVGIGDCSANKFVIEVFGKIGIICPVVFDAQQEILTDISLAILNI